MTSTNIFASDFLSVPYGLVMLLQLSPEFLEALSSRNEFLSVLRSKFGAKTRDFGFSSLTFAQVVQNRRSKALRARLDAAHNLFFDTFYFRASLRELDGKNCFSLFGLFVENDVCSLNGTFLHFATITNGKRTKFRSD